MTIPSLETLRAFEAAARLNSYSRAGTEIGLSHSAVSRRIRDLEKLVGEALFERHGNLMVPTSAGRRLVVQVRSAMDMLESIFPPTRRRRRPALGISVLPALALRWLVPRLAAFRSAHPDVAIAIAMDAEPVALGEGIEAAIRFGTGPWPDTDCIRLCREQLFPVCSPDYREALELTSPEDLGRATLLSHPWHPWSPWLRAAGVDMAEPNGSPQYADSSMLLSAAEAGEGVALARGLAVVDALDQGTLVRPFATTVRASGSYFLVWPALRPRPELDVFARWLEREMAASAAKLAQ